MSVPAVDMTVLPGIPSSGNVATYIVPDGTIANLSAPSLAAVNGASVYASCLLTESPEVTTEQETWDDNRECLEFAIERQGREKTTITGLTVLADPQDPAAELSKADTALAKGTTVVLVIRRGVRSRDPLAAGQIVDVYKVQVGSKSWLKPEENTSFRRSVNLSVLDKAEGVKLVA